MIDDGFVGLEEHLGDGGGAAHVAVDLEGRVSVKEIWISALGAEQGTENAVGALAVLHACPKIEPPCDGPASGDVAACFQAVSHGGCELGRAAKGDLVARVKGVEVRDVAMASVRGGGVPILMPFLELARCADAVGRQSVAGGGNALGEFGIGAEDGGGAHAGVEEIAQDLIVHGGAGGEGDAGLMGVFRRVGRAGHELAGLGVGHEGIEKELGRAFEQRVGAGEKVAIAGKQVVLPKVKGQPCAAGGPGAMEGAIDGSGGAPEIGVVVGDPAACAVVVASELGTGLGEVLHHGEEGLGALGEIGDL